MAFGDSITAGGRASDTAHAWPSLVASSLSKTPVIAAIGGTVLQNTVQNSILTIGAAAVNNGRDTYVSRLLAYSPSPICILYGLNDLRLNDVTFTADLFENDLSEIIDGLVANGFLASNIVIGSPPYMDTYDSYGAPWDGGSSVKHAVYVAKCAAVATAKSTKYADVYQAMADNGGAALLDGDQVHPNDAGHAVIAAAFLSAM